VEAHLGLHTTFMELQPPIILMLCKSIQSSIRLCW